MDTSNFWGKLTGTKLGKAADASPTKEGISIDRATKAVDALLALPPKEYMESLYGGVLNSISAELNRLTVDAKSRTATSEAKAQALSGLVQRAISKHAHIPSIGDYFGKATEGGEENSPTTERETARAFVEAGTQSVLDFLQKKQGRTGGIDSGNLTQETIAKLFRSCIPAVNQSLLAQRHRYGNEPKRVKALKEAAARGADWVSRFEKDTDPETQFVCGELYIEMRAITEQAESDLRNLPGGTR